MRLLTWAMFFLVFMDIFVWLWIHQWQVSVQLNKSDIWWISCFLIEIPIMAEIWFHGLSSWLFFAAAAAVSTWQMLQDDSWWKFSIRFISIPLTLSVWLLYPQYFFFLLFIFLIELVAGVLAYVYYQRVSEYFLAGYCCSSNDDATFNVTVKWSL